MEIIVLAAVLAFIFGFLDYSIGMGFGTSLAPLLLVLGFEPLAVVPTLLFSQAITGFVAGFFHNKLGNFNFSLKKPLNLDTKLVFLFSGVGCIAIVFSVLLAYFALQLPNSFTKVYVSVLLIGMGFLRLIKIKFRYEKKFKPKVLAGFAFLAGFNKGIGGGGYGPVLTLGQLFAGIKAKNAVAIVTLSESIVSVIGFLFFLFISTVRAGINFSLVPSVLGGALIAAILSPFVVRVSPEKWWEILIPAYAFIVGTYSLSLFLFT